MTLTIDEKFALLQDMKVIDNNRQIVERLKKYLKNIDADILDKEKVLLCDEYSCKDNVRKAVQKILGEEK